MIEDILSSVPAIVIVGYESFVQTFGSPVVLLAISATLIVIAAIEIWVRKCINPATEAR